MLKQAAMQIFGFWGRALPEIVTFFAREGDEPSQANVLALSVKPCRACQLSQRESLWRNRKLCTLAGKLLFVEGCSLLTPKENQKSASDFDALEPRKRGCSPLLTPKGWATPEKTEDSRLFGVKIF